MNTRIWVVLTTLALGSGAVYAANASGMGDCEGHSRWGMEGKHDSKYGSNQGNEQHKGRPDAEQMQRHRLDKLGQQLGLTEAQRQQVDRLLSQHPQQMVDKQEQMQQFRSQMHRLDPAAADYQDQVAVLAKQKAELMSQQLMARARLHAEIYAILTPEQQQAFRQLEPQRRDRQRRDHQG